MSLHTSEIHIVCRLVAVAQKKSKKTKTGKQTATGGNRDLTRALVPAEAFFFVSFLTVPPGNPLQCFFASSDRAESLTQCYRAPTPPIQILEVFSFCGQYLGIQNRSRHASKSRPPETARENR